jgi:HD-GYP domain-containing protein (c-di-GMP phosphodiesterase class II)
MFSKIKLTSFENASLVRKMTILYFLMSILPVGVLYYFYLMVREHGYLRIEEPQFALIMVFVVSGVAVGYFSLRALLLSIVNVGNKNNEMLKEILGPDKVKSFDIKDTNEVKVLAQSFNQITAHLEENVRNLELAKKTLHSVISRIGEGLSSMENIDSFLELIVQTMTEALDGKMGFLFLTDDASGDFYLKSVFGVDLTKIPVERIYREDFLFRDICQHKQPVVMAKIHGASVLAPILESPILAAPLILHENVIGVIFMSGRISEEAFTEEEKALLYNLALQTAVAVENSKLNEDKDRTYFETISALAMAVEAKDPYSRGHLDRVANIALQIADAMDLPKEDVIALRDAAKLHDLGKIGVVDEVLTKAGPLTRDEKLVMQRHPEIGESIIKPISSLNNLCDMIRHHHERLDGSGYPDGLQGDEIHLLARVLMVADIFDAITSDRPYHKALTSAGAIRELRLMGGKIDQHIVDVLEKVV